MMIMIIILIINNNNNNNKNDDNENFDIDKIDYAEISHHLFLNSKSTPEYFHNFPFPLLLFPFVSIFDFCCPFSEIIQH